MQCPSCSFANEADAQFCENCGFALERTCPNCGNPVSPTAKFCRICGFRFGAARSTATPAPLLTELDRQLQMLQSVDLIRARQHIPELEYIFRHALTQEAVYQTMPLQRRRDFHLRVGEALEGLFSHHLDDHYSVLAHHFHEANDVRALKYDVLAGDAAFRLYALNESITHYRRALALAHPQPSRAQESLQHVWLRCGRAHELLGQFDEAYTLYEEMERFAEQAHDRTLEIDSLVARAVLHGTMSALHDPLRAIALCERALSLALALGDRAGEAKVLWTMMLGYLLLGDNPHAIAVGEQSLAIARELNLREQMAQTLNDLFYAHGLSGTDEALALMSEAQSLWRELGNVPMLIDSLSSVAFALVLRGEFDAALALCSESFKLSKQTGNVWGQSYTGVVLGYAYRERNQIALALQSWHDAIETAEQINHLGTLVGARADLGLLYAQCGDMRTGEALITAALEAAKQSFPGWLAWPVAALIQINLLRGDLRAAEAAFALGCDVETIRPEYAPPLIAVFSALGELALARGDAAAALRAADQWWSYLTSREIYDFRSHARYLRARAHLLARQPGEARVQLQQAIEASNAIGSGLDVWQFLLALAAVEQQSGHGDDAEHSRAQAREHVCEVAEQLDVPRWRELRAKFLALPRVHALLDGEAR